MLLQTLNEFYGRACRDGLIKDAAFASDKYLRWVIPLNADGQLIGSGLQEIAEPKKEKGVEKGGRLFDAPRSSRPKNAGGVAEFLWDSLEAVFCLAPDPDAQEPSAKKRAAQEANRRAKFEDFWRNIAAAHAATQHAALSALLEFRARYLEKAEPPPFLRWGATKAGEKPAWLVTTATGGTGKFKADNFTFAVNGNFLLDDPQLRVYWRKAFESEQTTKSDNVERGLCLVTGAIGVPISDSHLPKIAGVPGAVATGAALVSFDKDAFRSYGFEKSYNSPVSLPAVEAYCNALNFLLKHEKHRLRLGDTALCFWAQESEAASDLFAALFEQPRPEVVRGFLSKPRTGNRDYALPTGDAEKFYGVTLGGNAGRVVVRDWLATTVEQAETNFRQWFTDLDIVTYGTVKDNDKAPPLSLFRLAVSTVRETKDLRPEALTQLYRAALLGTAPSIMSAHGALSRLNVDLIKNGTSALLNLSRFALLRLVINRNKKEHEPMIEPIITETDDAAYNCGRLLAIFDELQMAAHEYKLEGAGVVERYYGTASSAPNSAFGILWRLHQHHLKKIGRSQAGKAEALKRKIEGIAAQFKARGPRQPPVFPRSFNLPAQGRFALGFYQQKASERAARQAYLDEKKATATTASEN